MSEKHGRSEGAISGHADRVGYIILLVATFMGALYSLAWAIADALIRISEKAAARFPPTMVEFVREVSLGQEVLFFIAVAISVINLGLVLRRSRWAVAGYAAAPLLISLDWILSGWFGLEATATSGLIGMVLGAVGFLVAYWLSFRGVLWRRGL